MLGSRHVSRDVTIEHLRHSHMPTIGKEIEGLGLDVGRVHCHPFQIVLGDLAVRRRLGLLGYGLQRGGPIDGFGGACDVRSSAIV